LLRFSKSHNFRPSYYKLGNILKQRLRVPCVLALTATATKETERSITKALSIPSLGIVQALHVCQNLHLSVSRPSHKQVRLQAQLFQSQLFQWFKLEKSTDIDSASDLFIFTGGKTFLHYLSQVHFLMSRASSSIAHIR
jgi:hypothetical protein